MVQEEITYEQSLYTMNEEGLRTECVRLKNKLDMIHVMNLTQTKPIESSNNDIYETIGVLKQDIAQLRHNHTVDTTDNDLVALFKIVDVLIFIVGLADADVQKLAVKVKEHDMAGSCGHK